MQVQHQMFLTSAPDDNDSSASRHGRFTPGGKISPYVLKRKLGGPQTWSGRFGNVKPHLLLPEISNSLVTKQVAQSV
jgi:hypothetical protein